MHGRHSKKAPKRLIYRGALVFVLAIVMCVSSFATVVMANTVSAIVIDGDKSYTFNMINTDLDQILAQAEERGLEPLGPLDVAEQVANTTTVNVRRGVSLSVLESGERTNLVAYRGDTVLETLESNNIIVKDDDQVLPSRDALVTAGLTVEILRSCQVTVSADGKAKKLTMLGGTVADALKEAGVTLGQRDTASYPLEEPLFNSMIIRVNRPARLTITVDGETLEKEVSADTVYAALKKAGVVLGSHDRVNVNLKAKPEDGMKIIVTRVTVEEVIETEPVDYETEYVDTDELYEGETQVQTYGEEGEKKVTYEVIYVEGELEGREAVSEEITREPVTEVILRGTGENPQETPSVPSGGSSSGGVGTFVDMYGNTVSYSSVMEGTCTAYYPINPTTSIGATAGYGCIAVNPNIIPYGTRMYVTSRDGSVVYGYGVACDTGGACMSGTILADLCYDTIEECSQIGRRNMVVYILS